MEIIFASIYILHQKISANLDLFYFLSIVLILKDVIERRSLTWRAVGYVYFAVLYAFLQILMNDHVEVGRLVVNLSKLFLNIVLFLQVKEMKVGLNSFKKIIYAASAINLVLLCIGMVHKTKLLWRLDDDVNLYQKVRLALFYAEPSEASFHAGILIVILVSFIMRETGLRKNMINLFFLSANAGVVIVSAGMGGMLSLGLALTVMYIYYLGERISVPKLLAAMLLSIVGVFALFRFAASNNSFYMRFNDIVNGTDGSVFYRFNVSARIMGQILVDSNFIGTGWGNLNTDAVKNTYYSHGLVEIIANSFMYVIAEGGIGAILLLFVFLVMLVMRVRRHERVFKYGLLIFILSYQIAGGYFTNPVNWILYGLIANHTLLSDDRKSMHGLAFNIPRINQNDYSKREIV
ncbi:hypothetical protein [Paenibacillus azoreducens]|uniref:O-antigen ligase domain-containing protein n=1 Tax=Paenibacillus azoreducens TaxID=116718 RepID=A0A920CSB1_9BACL|nr:hypothetical protein [Paenibacillus azoreducens]GIO49105.1 hypothetical protein J34TS1_38700 [Paenibacillus azoreducens]